ncbi:DNA integrity scanning diadenylate cyclase DisA [Candidatus Pacearchaeota archaeon]|nr:DNA integrity scanning diadenylate cyclase DisA [Candidatus Pacearchaeota archaeon]
MVAEKEKSFRDFIKMISPGTLLRTVIDDVVRSGLGAMIVFDTKELHTQNIIEGGFRINSRLTPQKLLELCKMDGAIIISQDFKRILYANILMTPDNSIHSTETGTRHKAAERTAKQAHTFVIAISERKKKTTLYYSQSRYHLKSTDEIMRNLSSTLQVLEKQREMLNEQLNNLNILEMSELVSISDVCKVIQRTEMILKISESIKRNFTELGKEGNIMHMRYRELIRGVEKTEDEIIRDYATLSLKRSKTLLSNLTFEGLLDTKSIARLILEKPIEESISPKGFRFLAHLTLSEKENSLIVKQFKNLENILKSDSSELESILKNRADTIKEEIRNLREQVLNGKVIC